VKADRVAVGMRYDGLVWIDDRWVWFPEAWPRTLPPPGHGDT
jgi:hypothetical protein